MRIHFYILSVTACLSVILTASASEDTYFPLPLFPELNQRFKISYFIDNEKKLSPPTGILIEASLEVKKITPDGFIAEWTTNLAQTKDDLLIKSNSPQASSLLIGVPLQFHANANGTPLKVVDIDNILTSITNSVAFSEVEPKVLQQVISFISSMSEESLAQLFFQVPSFMAACQGTNLKIGELSRKQVPIENPFGGQDILSEVEFLLRHIDELKKEVEIGYSSNYNIEGNDGIIEQIYKSLGLNDAIPHDKLDDLTLSRTDSSTCLVDIDTGWVTLMEHTIETKINGESKLERYTVIVESD